MREETANWLEPMIVEADRQGIDIKPLMYPASMPAAEADNPFLDSLADVVPGIEHRAMDWVRFGQLLRHEIGWDDTYPAYPDFPEAREGRAPS
jgi:hypothetical protein